MKKLTKTIALATALCAPLLVMSPAAQAADACEIVLCMFGKFTGNSQSECKAAEREYFAIQVKKKGKFKPSDTAKERLKKLNECPSPENDKINKKFGTMR